MKTLILDNYDSFTYNLYQYVAELGGCGEVHRNDALTIEDVSAMGPTHIILSPGPGNPYTDRDIGISRLLIDFAIDNSVPLLGVCLGHQTLGVHFGSTVCRAPEMFHGKASKILMSDPCGILLENVSDHCEVMRYHSLHVEDVPQEFSLTAQTEEGIIMAMEHNSLPLYGIQFHPESIGTPDGKTILRNFLTSQS